MVLQEKYTLNNGIEVPEIAFGTWQISNEDVIAAVSTALQTGYRHIDTAVLYQNEEGVGKAIRESGIPREEIFVTTKIPPEVKTYEDAEKCIKESIARLDIGVIDQVLIHSPKPWNELLMGSSKSYYKENLAVWKAMEDAVIEGKVRSIGVSNFEISDLENILKNGKIKPAVNQIELHIGHTPKDIMEYCQKNNILIMAYSPNATGKLIDDPTVKKIAGKYGVSVPQLSIRYDLQLGTLPLPRSTNPAHIKENAELDFVITEEDINTLNQVKEKHNLWWRKASRVIRNIRRIGKRRSDS